MVINITYIIFLWYNKGTTFSSLIVGMISYQIILPYVFLMNTSHNKNRIVEFGWKNVLMNIIGRPSNSVEPNEQMPKDKHESEALELEKMRKSSRIPSDNNKTYISVISSNALQSNLLKDDSPSQSTSYEKRYVPEDQVKHIISSMIRCANDEEIYIEYFKKLVDFQECRKKGTVYSDVAKEDIFLSACSATSIPRLSLKGELKDRVIMRTEILKGINGSPFEDDTHHNFIEKLIDLEENFVQEC